MVAEFPKQQAGLNYLTEGGQETEIMYKVSLCTLGHLEIGDPPVLGQLMGELARKHPHIDVWGGCCGTWETHLDEIARNVTEAREVGAAF